MGTDNLFHKRRAKSTAKLKRKKARREIYKKILIVCEGEKTELYYFKDAREFYSLSTVDVEIYTSKGSDPKNIVYFANQKYRESKDAGDPFDNIYCVFDKDTHTGYGQAVSALESATPKGVFFAITSVPCFEYWLLLHFTYSTRPYQTVPGNSASNQVLTELKKYLSNYQKGHQKIFTKLQNKMEKAKNSAIKASQECERNQTDNPSTRIHKLVQILENLKNNL